MDPSFPAQALVWADVTEFTRAMEASETAMAHSTLAWVDRCVQGWLVELQGRFLQQAGDAVLLAFDHPGLALQAAHRLRQDWDHLAPLEGSGWGRELRVALHWGQVRQGSQGVVGHSVNQLARLAQEVVPGQIWCSAAFWQRLPPRPQRLATELGWMHFRHLDAPLQVFRLWPHRVRPVRGVVLNPGTGALPPRPRLAIQSAPGAQAWEWTQAVLQLGEQDVEADITALAPGSTERSQALEVLQRCGADYLLWRAPEAGPGHRVSLWAAESGFEVAHWVLQADADAAQVHGLWPQARSAWQRHALGRALSDPPPTLSPGLLAYGALQLMHAGDLRDFDRADALLALWQQRQGRSALPMIWRLLWQVMRHTRGLPGVDLEAARHHAQAALRLGPEVAHVWAASGFAHGHLHGGIDQGLRALEQASSLQADLPWIAIYRATLSCLAGEPEQGMKWAQHALNRPTPEGLDDYVRGLAGHAAVFAQHTELGARWLESSWRRHRHHSPTLRMLAVAHQRMGHASTARLFMRELMMLEPQLTARNYLARNRAGHAHRAEMAHWLIQAGLPLR
ncbi:MAG: hypothetical protein RIT26_1309 [Pseudomonadota bacterium]|jgi:class 3 adenylate cyclase